MDYGQEAKLHLETQLALKYADRRICWGMFVGVLLLQRAFNQGGGLGRILSMLHVADA